MNIIDLSMPIQPHFRWPFRSELAYSYEKGDPYQSTNFTMSAHSFTHLDTPLHFKPGQITVDEIPLDQLTGPMAIMDLSYVAANQAIGAADLEKNADNIEEGDIVVLKTEWDLKRSWESREFWLEAPYLDAEAAGWLSEQKIKAVGFDFPQDYAIREIPGRHPSPREMPAHDLILSKGIYFLEYLCNVHKITVPRATLFALPLKLAGCEGAPVRVIAVVD